MDHSYNESQSLVELRRTQRDAAVLEVASGGDGEAIAPDALLPANLFFLYIAMNPIAALHEALEDTGTLLVVVEAAANPAHRSCTLSTKLPSKSVAGVTVVLEGVIIAGKDLFCRIMRIESCFNPL